MKTLVSTILLICIVSIIFPACTALEAKLEERRTKRETEVEEGYEANKKMAFSGLYIFSATHVYPGGGYPSTDISGRDYYLSVNVYDVEAYLPFYGFQYMPVDKAAIEIDGKLEDIMIEESDNRKRVLIRFSVTSESDRYLVNLDIGPSGNAHLTISSSKRSTITYVGKVTPLEPDEEGEENKNTGINL